MEVLLFDFFKEMVEDEEGLFEEVYILRVVRLIELEVNNLSEEEMIGVVFIDEFEINILSVDGIMEVEYVDDLIFELGFELRGLIDVEFDEILDGIFEDLVKIFLIFVIFFGIFIFSVFF